MSKMRQLRRLCRMPANRLWTVPALLLLGGCLTPDQRPAQLAAIARWQDQRLAPADSLAALLTGDDAHVRLAAVRAAGLIGRNDVLTQLHDALTDPSRTVRAEAAWALGLIGDERALADLDTAAADRNPQLRLAAIAALGQLPNDGAALLVAAADPDPATSAAAWDALRNQAARVAPDSLRQAIAAGLERPETEVRWRVLRCAEMLPDTTLVPLIAPFASGPRAQEAVHAFRALARQAPTAALPAVLAGVEQAPRRSGRDRSRVLIASCRALGAVGTAALADAPANEHRADFIAAELINAAGHDDPHVAETALDAMARLVAEQPLPPEAAAQESLLPVWRIRLARAARTALASPHVGVRAAAMTALGALRGVGAGRDLQIALDQERSPHVLAAGMAAIATAHPMPVLVLSAHCGRAFDSAFATKEGRPISAMVRAAALTGLNEVRLHRPEAALAPFDLNHIEGRLLSAASDPDFVVSTTAAGLLGTLPTDEALLALTTLWDRADGGGRFEMQRGVIGGLAELLTPAGPDSLPPWQGPDELRDEARRVLRESFDSPDIRLRREGRAAALATGLLPANLVPTAGSLLATLPAVRRDPRQPPVTTAFAAPDLRCVSERGEFVITLAGDLAPNTCALFLALVRDDYFGAMTFHRVVPDFVVQGGDPSGTGWGGPGFTIRSEWSRTPYDRAAVGIAHDGKDTGGSQFFVTLSPQPHLNGRYTIFGHVTSGMEVVDLIEVGDTFRLELAD